MQPTFSQGDYDDVDANMNTLCKVTKKSNWRERGVSSMSKS